MVLIHPPSYFLNPFLQTFNYTDTVLQSVTTWPNIEKVDFFDTKLKFQIQHSIFRTKVIPPKHKSRFSHLHASFLPDSRG